MAIGSQALNILNTQKVLDELKVGGFPLTSDQKEGLLKLAMWLHDAKRNCAMHPDKPPVFRLFGLGGCGKTTMSVALRFLGFKPLYLSFTNRAVGVLVSKDCYPARTLHSVLYDVMEGDDEMNKREQAMKMDYLAAVEAGVPIEERPPLPPSRSKLGFQRREWAEIQEIVSEYDFIVVDEASMVGKRMGVDLEFVGLPIVGVGDPGQLPPVGDWPYFDPKRPDVLLTKVLRTDGDILSIAAHVRRGGFFPDMPRGRDYEVSRKAHPSWFDADQVLCGIHDKRRALNAHVRKLRGYEGFLPLKGEKICVVSNNKEHDVSNGSLWTVISSRSEGDYAILDLLEYAPRKKKEELEVRHAIPVHMTCFVQDIRDSNDISINVRYNSVYATWGYAITVHKSQGSEWDSVLLFDDSPVFREFRRNWAYTGATRAAKKLYVVSRHTRENTAP